MGGDNSGGRNQLCASLPLWGTFCLCLRGLFPVIGSLVNLSPGKSCCIYLFYNMKDTSGRSGELVRVQVGEDMITYMI